MRKFYFVLVLIISFSSFSLSASTCTINEDCVELTDLCHTGTCSNGVCVAVVHGSEPDCYCDSRTGCPSDGDFCTYDICSHGFCKYPVKSGCCNNDSECFKPTCRPIEGSIYFAMLVPTGCHIHHYCEYEYYMTCEEGCSLTSPGYCKELEYNDNCTFDWDCDNKCEYDDGSYYLWYGAECIGGTCIHTEKMKMPGNSCSL